MKDFFIKFKSMPAWVQWMPAVFIVMLSIAIGAAVDTRNQLATAQAQIESQNKYPTFRDKFNAHASVLDPALEINECKSSPSVGKNRDTLMECSTKTAGATLLLSSLNNRFTGAILEVNVSSPDIEQRPNLTKAIRIFLRLSRGKEPKDNYTESLESMAILSEAQQYLGESACEDTPANQVRFCVVTKDKKIYNLGLVNPLQWN